MKTRTLIYLSLALLVGMAVLLGFFLAPLFFKPSAERYISYNNVRGSAIQHKNKVYTLNFDQQNEIVGFINKSAPFETGIETGESLKLNFEKLIIYPFDAHEIVIYPIEYDRSNNLIFTMLVDHETKLLKDVSHGEMKKLISQTYDH